MTGADVIDTLEHEGFADFAVDYKGRIVHLPVEFQHRAADLILDGWCVFWDLNEWRARR